MTNLMVPNEQMWRKLVRSGALISASFDAGQPEMFAKVRRGARSDVVLRNLDVLFDEAHVSGTGNIYLNVVVQPASLSELTVIAAHAARASAYVCTSTRSSSTKATPSLPTWVEAPAP